MERWTIYCRWGEGIQGVFAVTPNSLFSQRSPLESLCYKATLLKQSFIFLSFVIVNFLFGDDILLQGPPKYRETRLDRKVHILWCSSLMFSAQFLLRWFYYEVTAGFFSYQPQSELVFALSPGWGICSH